MRLPGFLGRSDPSDEWSDYVPRPIVLDLGSATLCGIRLGAPAGDLARLGKPSNPRPFQSQRFDYLDAGFGIEIEANAVDYFGVEVGRFTLVFPDRRQLAIHAGTSWNELRPRLPKPASTERDEDETVHTIALDDLTLEVECSPDGLIRRVNLFASR